MRDSEGARSVLSPVTESHNPVGGVRFVDFVFPPPFQGSPPFQGFPLFQGLRCSRAYAVPGLLRASRPFRLPVPRETFPQAPLPLRFARGTRLWRRPTPAVAFFSPAWECWNSRICFFGVSGVDAGAVHRRRRPYHQHLRHSLPPSRPDPPGCTPQLLRCPSNADVRSEEHTSELQSRFGISYAVFCLK